VPRKNAIMHRRSSLLASRAGAIPRLTRPDICCAT
jgi:hypothetical protein